MTRSAVKQPNILLLRSDVTVNNLPIKEGSLPLMFVVNFKKRDSLP